MSGSKRISFLRGGDFVEDLEKRCWMLQKELMEPAALSLSLIDAGFRALFCIAANARTSICRASLKCADLCDRAARKRALTFQI